MRAVQRKLRGVSTTLAIMVAVVFVASPLAAQKTSLTVTGGTITRVVPGRVSVVSVPQYAPQ